METMDTSVCRAVLKQKCFGMNQFTHGSVVSDDCFRRDVVD